MRGVGVDDRTHAIMENLKTLGDIILLWKNFAYDSLRRYQV